VKIVIVGCGRVGAVLAEAYDATGHEVVILDLAARAFDRLPAEFRGSALRGDGTDEDTLRRAGADGADIFLALTEGDNRNVMAAQVALEKLTVGRVVAKINDPVRAAAYAELGVATVCRTSMLADAISNFLGLTPSGVPSVIAPSGRHHAAPDHDPLVDATASTGAHPTGPGGTAGASPATTVRIAGPGAGREG
jgi:trk system potassium uptake protein TrkA